MWNASFFCGSCAVLKRQPLEEVGGIAVETVTEDAHTALKMHRRGYQTAYLNIPLAAGLATESLADHIGQRMRWARGMAQIFRLDNPLLGKGLNWAQRLCYSNAMLYFLNGGPRLIFLTAPLAFLLLGSYIVYAPCRHDCRVCITAHHPREFNQLAKARSVSTLILGGNVRDRVSLVHT